MELARTPLLLERRHKTRHSTHKAADIARYRGRRKRKLPYPFVASTRGMNAPSIGLAMGSAVGPISVGGIMKHS